MRAALLFSMLIWTPLSVAASKPAAAPPRVARGVVEARLRAYQPDASAWRALGAGGDQVLIEIGGDGKVEVLLRARALSTLAYFQTAAARKFLETTIDSRATSSDPADRVLVRKAAVSLGWLGGFHVPARLAPLLDSADPDVRLDAAIGLGLTRLPAAAESLRRRLNVETTPQVRTQISRQIQIIEDARPAAPAAKR